MVSKVSKAHKADAENCQHEPAVEQIRTTCPYCGVGCGVVAKTVAKTVADTVTDTEHDHLIAVSGDRDHPANLGRLCVKGSALAESMVGDGRLLYPRLSGAQVSWDRALDEVAQRLRDTVQRYGPKSVAFYLSGQLLTEDYYVANKLMKGFIGSANVDTNSRLCMASAVAGYKRALGADYVPCSYEDLESCDLLVMVGSNAAWTHPVLYQRIAAARQAGSIRRVVVIDPRRTATCELADEHLAIAPGSDAFLFAGLLQYLQRENLLDQEYIDRCTEGFDALLQSASLLEISDVAAKTGLTTAQVREFFQDFGTAQRPLTFYSQGINQSATGTDKCNAIINCHLATGKIGKPGCGPFSITGQPNAMGGREVGGLANQLAAHMDFRPSHRDVVGRFWEATDVADEAGLLAVDLFDAMGRGEIKFVWIMATNPAVSLPDSTAVRQALERCEYVVVSDCSDQTDTCAYADALLPALGWGEKDGTVTNSERCISRQRALVKAPGDARADWWIVSQVAARLGYGEQFAYRTPRDIFCEHAALSGFENNGSRDFDISALAQLSEQDYQALPPTYWPCPAGEAVPGPAEGRYFTDTGRARFVGASPELPRLDALSAEPLRLNTGRVRDQWHTMTRTGQVPRLMRHYERFCVHVNREDAARYGLSEGALAAVENTRGRVVAQVRIDPGQPPGQVFCPIHWNDQFTAQGCVSSLIAPVTDPVSGQPQSKYAAVSLRPVQVDAWGWLLSRQRPRMADCLYWSGVAVKGGYLTLLAMPVFPRDLAQCCNSWLSPGDGRALRYSDTTGRDERYVQLSQGGLQCALFVAAELALLPERDWLEAQLDDASTFDFKVLAGVDVESENKGRMVCSCHEVGENPIRAAITAGASTVEMLGKQLRCGTQCGSCVPELRELLRNVTADVAVEA